LPVVRGAGFPAPCLRAVRRYAASPAPWCVRAWCSTRACGALCACVLAQASALSKEKLRPRKKLPPLLVALPDRKPETLHWLGTSFGVTLELFNFWQRCGRHRPRSPLPPGKHARTLLPSAADSALPDSLPLPPPLPLLNCCSPPLLTPPPAALTCLRPPPTSAGYIGLYLRQTPNELTGEFTTIMVKPLATSGGVGCPQVGWHRPLSADFSRRLINLFAYAFRDFAPELALSVVENGRRELVAAAEAEGTITPAELAVLLSPHDLMRLEAYSRNLVRVSRVRWRRFPPFAARSTLADAWV
jgi:tRNA(Met) C34 N-acetyltransferase TmcA